MEVQGRIHNGVVVLEGDLPLPEGTPVTVTYRGAPTTGSPAAGRPVRLPLVRSDRPGSRPLTAERVADIPFLNGIREIPDRAARRIEIDGRPQ